MIDVRDKLEPGMSRDRLILEVKRAGRPAAVVLAGAFLALLCAGYLAVRVSPTLLHRKVTLRFGISDATGVVAGPDEVRVYGVPAGRITEVGTRQGRPVLTVKLDARYGPIYRDARAQLRPNTALQDMYLDIVDRGTPAAGEAKGDQPISAAQTSTPVDVNDVLDAFNPSVRAHLSTVLATLGNGLADHGAQLRESFAQAAPLVQSADRIATQLADRSVMTKRLVHNTSLLTAELGARQGQLETLVAEGSRTVGTLEAHEGSLAQTIDALPGALQAIPPSFAAVRGVLGDVNEAVVRLGPTAKALPGSLDAVTRLSRTARPTLQALQPAVARLTPLVRSLRPDAQSLSSSLARLQPQTSAFDKVTLDAVRCEKGVEGFFQWDASLTKYGDARGAIPRGNAVVGLGANSTVATPYEFAPQACTPGQAIDGRLPEESDKR